MRTKALSLVTALVVAVPALASPVSAAEYTGPTITSPTQDETVSGSVTVSVDSQASHVLLELVEARSYGTEELVDAVVPVVDGVATYDWESVGFRNGRVEATDCTSAAATDCTGPSDSVTVVVTNPTDTIESPTGQVFTNPDEDGPLPVTVTASDAPGDVFVYWASGGRLRDRVAAVPGTPAELSIGSYPSTVAEGVLRVLRCNPDNPNICATTAVDGPELTVRRSLDIGFQSVTPYWFSPDGNGRLDTVTAKVRFEDLPGQSATWTITDEAGEMLPGTPQPIDVPGGADAGTFTDVVVDPHAAGFDLSTGNYKVRVDATATDHDREFTGSTSFTVHVDTDLAEVTGLQAQAARFFPYGDGFRDTIGVVASIDAAADSSTYTPRWWADVRVLDSDGNAVDKATGLHLKNGEGFTWDGRTSSGELAPVGTYRFKVTLRDQAGNHNVFTGGDVWLSHKRLVSKTWVRRVSARRSLALDDSGRCSKLRFPGIRGWRGSVGYLSQAKCRGRAGNSSRIAAGIHAIRLPRAIRHDRVAIAAYGGQSRPGTRHRAGFHYFGRQGQLGRTKILRPRVRWHGTGGRSAKRMLHKGRWIYWAVTAADGQRYDVRRFRVRLTYRVLR